MKKLLVGLTLLTSMSSFASTFTCDNLGKNYSITVSSEAEIVNVKGFMSYDCELHDFNLDGFVGGGPDGIKCSGDLGLSKNFIVLENSNEAIKLIPLEEVGQTHGFDCTPVE